TVADLMNPDARAIRELVVSLGSARRTGILRRYCLRRRNHVVHETRVPVRAPPFVDGSGRNTISDHHRAGTQAADEAWHGALGQQARLSEEFVDPFLFGLDDLLLSRDL